MLRKLALLLVAPAFYACGDRIPSEPAVPTGPQWAVADARTAGNIPGFYFLPPIRSHPDYTGSFSSTLTPEVVICELSGSDCGSNIVATFTTTTGLGGEVVRVSTVDEHYLVNWHTDLSNLSTNSTYRIQVFVGSLRLGFADVQPVSSGREMRNAEDDYVALKDGRTLPIKFRLEEIIAQLSPSELVELAGIQAVQDCLQAASCVVEHVEPNDPSGEQVVITADQYFAGVFQNGFMDSYVGSDPATYGDGVTVIIYQRDLPCFVYAGQQAEACSHRETYPALTDGFDFPQRVEQCLDPAVPIDDYQLHKFSLIGPVAEQGQVVPLPRVNASYIDCSTFMQPAASAALQVAQSLLRPILRAFGPVTAYAGDVRYGGMTTSYSEIGYARPLTLQYVAGDGQTTQVGTAVPVRPTVRVMEGVNESGHNPPLVPSPIAGIPVTFTVGQGGLIDGLSSTTVLTDANGEASADWVLGAQAGSYTVTAAIAGGQSVNYMATAGSANGPDLSFGFQSPQTFAPISLWRWNGQSWTEAIGNPVTVYTGETIEMRVYFVNSGDTEIANGFIVMNRFSQNDTWMTFNWPVGTLLLSTQGYVASTRPNVTGPTSGCTSSVAEAQLDGGQQVSESDENNNFGTLSYQICAPPA